MKQTSSTRTTYYLLTLLDNVLVGGFLFVIVLFKLLAVPFQLLSTLLNVEIDSQSDNNALEAKLIQHLREWTTNHAHDIADAQESFGPQESYFSKITPKNDAAATLIVEIGYPQYLRVSIENFGIEFSGEDFDNGERVLNDILIAYENGQYYLKKWLFHGVVVDKALIIELENGKKYSSKTDDFKLFRKWFSKIKRKEFSAIAAINLS